MERIVYIATCINGDNETIKVTNTNYEALMDGIDRYGFDVLDVVEMDYEAWVNRKEKDK